MIIDRAYYLSKFITGEISRAVGAEVNHEYCLLVISTLRSIACGLVSVGSRHTTLCDTWLDNTIQESSYVAKSPR